MDMLIKGNILYAGEHDFVIFVICPSPRTVSLMSDLSSSPQNVHWDFALVFVFHFGRLCSLLRQSPKRLGILTNDLSTLGDQEKGSIKMKIIIK